MLKEEQLPSTEAGTRSNFQLSQSVSSHRSRPALSTMPEQDETVSDHADELSEGIVGRPGGKRHWKNGERKNQSPSSKRKTHQMSHFGATVRLITRGKARLLPSRLGATHASGAAGASPSRPLPAHRNYAGPIERLKRGVNIVRLCGSNQSREPQTNCESNEVTADFYCVAAGLGLFLNNCQRLSRPAV